VSASPPPILLDCDPGHDDAIAILLAAGRRDAVDLRAITTVGGNAPLELVTYNARRVMTLAGLHDVPVAAGAAGPLRGDELVTALDIHGESGLDGAPLPEPAVALDPRGAVELMAARGPATVVATGPLTNVALLLERAPEAVREIVWMGGSTTRGNTRPYAEFNAFVDPEAAAAVFASGVPLTMVGLNLTHQAQATPQVIERLRAVGNEAARVTIGWLGFFASTYRELYGLAGPPVHDPCALAAVIDSDLLRCVEVHVDVETEGRHTRGATVVDLHGRLGRPPNARVALELDVVGFWDLVIGAIARL
jgi:inosine/uridine nucleosidase